MLNHAITTLVITHALCCSISDVSMLMTERPNDTINSLQTNDTAAASCLAFPAKIQR